MAGVVYGVFRNNDYFLYDFIDSVVLRLSVPPGQYILIGKTVIGNSDADAQDATVRLTANDDLDQRDRADVRIEHDMKQEISLQGFVDIPADSDDHILHLRAQTQTGYLRDTKLYAIQVDGIKMSEDES